MTSLLLLISLAVSSLSCATSPPDFWVCAELYPDEGVCRKTLSDDRLRVNEKTKLNGKTWWEMRPTFIYLPPESWSEIKAFVIKICAKTKACNKEVPMWEKQIDSIDGLYKGVK